jgi:N utilization substance protein A
MLDYLERERGIKREILLEAVSNALLSASKKSVSASRELRIDINPKTGEIRALANLIVVDKVTNPQDEIAETAARRIKSDAKVGDVVEVEVTPKNFGRIAAQTAKQVVMQRIREAERDRVFIDYNDRIGDIISGVVQRTEQRDPNRPDGPGAIILEFGKVEAVLPPGEQVKSERYRVGQRLRVLLLDVQRNQRGPQLVVSRAHRNMLRRLLELEVPEIHNGTVEIKGIAREAGTRSKVAVASRQEGLDPVGACVGMRGIRIQNIVNELYGEKIDIVAWHPDMAVFIANALSPAQVVSVELLDDDKTAQVIVPERQLSLAIGKEGQNARLAAKLTGWRIDIKSVRATLSDEEEDLSRHVEALREGMNPEALMDLSRVPDFSAPMQQDERRKVRPNNTVVFQNQVYGPLPEDMVGEVVRVRVSDGTLQVRTDTRILATYPLEAAQPAEADTAAEDDMAPLVEDTAQVAEL